MSRLFEELAYRQTAIGLLSLRRRHLIGLDADVLEIKLDEEHLMSDLFTTSEIALARVGLARTEQRRLDVVVGGLGLGYTARAVLEDQRVSTLIVVEALEAVIDWHNAGLVPLGAGLAQDTRCRFVHGDFFAMSNSVGGFDPETPERRFDAILVDIDHAPDRFLAPQNAEFYEIRGLQHVRSHLKPDGVFGLWSDDSPDDGFTAKLATVFGWSAAVPVTFDNPLQNRPVTQTIYLARTAC